jgi:hypothetical protein
MSAYSSEGFKGKSADSKLTVFVFLLALRIMSDLRRLADLFSSVFG